MDSDRRSFLIRGAVVLALVLAGAALLACRRSLIIACLLFCLKPISRFLSLANNVVTWRRYDSQFLSITRLTWWMVREVNASVFIDPLVD